MGFRTLVRSTHLVILHGVPHCTPVKSASAVADELTVTSRSMRIGQQAGLTGSTKALRVDRRAGPVPRPHEPSYSSVT